MTYSEYAANNKKLLSKSIVTCLVSYLVLFLVGPLILTLILLILNQAEPPLVFLSMSLIIFFQTGLFLYGLLKKVNQYSTPYDFVEQNFVTSPLSPSNPKEKELIETIGALATSLNMVCPRVYLINHSLDDVNGFAISPHRNSSAIALTEGVKHLNTIEQKSLCLFLLGKIFWETSSLELTMSKLTGGLDLLFELGLELEQRASKASASPQKLQLNSELNLSSQFGRSLKILGLPGWILSRRIKKQIWQETTPPIEAWTVNTLQTGNGLTSTLIKAGSTSLSFLYNPSQPSVDLFCFKSLFHNKDPEPKKQLGILPPLTPRIQLLQPAFDGVFPEPTMAVDHSLKKPFEELGIKEISQDVAPKSPPPKTKPTRPPAPKKPPKPIAANSHFVISHWCDRMGSPDSKSIKKSDDFIKQIKAPIWQILNHPKGLKKLLFTVFTHSVPARQRMEILEVFHNEFGSQTRIEIQSILTWADELAQHQSMSLIQFIIPFTTQWNQQALKDFTQNLDMIVQNGPQLELPSFLKAKLIFFHLMNFHYARPSRNFAKPLQFKDVSDELATVISALIDFLSIEVDHPRLIQTWQQLRPNSTLVPVEVNFFKVSRALDRLGFLDPIAKHGFIQSLCYLVCSETETVTWETGDLLNSIACAIENPLPFS